MSVHSLSGERVGSDLDFEMKERIGVTFAVEFAPASLPETPTQVETNRSWVLFVDIHRGHAVPHDGLVEQRGTNAIATGRVRHEEHLERSLFDSGEADWPIVGIGNEHRDSRKLRGDQIGFDAFEIGLIEKVIGCAYGSAPDLQEFRILCRAVRRAEADLGSGNLHRSIIALGVMSL